MDRVAAEVAKKVAMLLQHGDLHAGAREQKAEHPAGRSAANDATGGFDGRHRGPVRSGWTKTRGRPHPAGSSELYVAVLSGVRTTRPSSSSLTLIWHDSCELGRRRSRTSMSSSIGEGRRSWRAIPPRHRRGGGAGAGTAAFRLDAGMLLRIAVSITVEPTSASTTRGPFGIDVGDLRHGCMAKARVERESRTAGMTGRASYIAIRRGRYPFAEWREFDI